MPGLPHRLVQPGDDHPLIVGGCPADQGDGIVRRAPGLVSFATISARCLTAM